MLTIALTTVQEVADMVVKVVVKMDATLLAVAIVKVVAKTHVMDVVAEIVDTAVITPPLNLSLIDLHISSVFI